MRMPHTMNLRRRFKVPTTTEDADAIDVVRVKIKKYFSHKGKDLHKAPEARAREAMSRLRSNFGCPNWLSVYYYWSPSGWNYALC